MFASCGQKEKNVKQLEQQYLVQPVDSFSGKDTSEVMYLVNSFIDKLNQKDIKSAVSMLSYLDGNDIVPLPAELVKRQCNALANAQGVKYTVDRLVFNEEKDNIVKVISCCLKRSQAIQDLTAFLCISNLSAKTTDGI